MDYCEAYFTKMKRHVYQTPKTFLQDYAVMYTKKSNEIVSKAGRVDIGLEKLASGATDVKKMKIVLAQEAKLKQTEESTNAMLSKL